MKKKLHNTKAPLIFLVAFVCALFIIYLCSEKPSKKVSSAIVTQELYDDSKQLGEEEDARDNDVQAEIWAKKEFLHHEITYGMDEDDEDEGEYYESEIYNTDLDHDEMNYGKDEDIEEEEDLDDEIPLVKEEALIEKNNEQLIDNNASAPPLYENHEEKNEYSLSSKDLDLEGKETFVRPNDIEVLEESKLTAFNDTTTQSVQSIKDHKSPFSTKAQVLSVIISNEPISDSEFDPYEDFAVPSKINITEGEPSTIHYPDNNVQVASIVENINEPQTPEKLKQGDTTLADKDNKEIQQAEKNQNLYKNYAAINSDVSHLITKFLQKTDYTKELNSINQTKLPPDVKEILNQMKDFAENDMKVVANDDVKIFPKEGMLSGIVGHFVHIEKITDSKLRDEKYEQIRMKLHVLEDYFYSQKFLQEMMDYE